MKSKTSNLKNPLAVHCRKHRALVDSYRALAAKADKAEKELASLQLQEQRLASVTGSKAVSRLRATVDRADQLSALRGNLDEQLADIEAEIRAGIPAFATAVREAGLKHYYSLREKITDSFAHFFAHRIAAENAASGTDAALHVAGFVSSLASGHEANPVAAAEDIERVARKLLAGKNPAPWRGCVSKK